MDINLQDIEILLIEDNLEDAELIVRTLKKNNVSNKLLHLADGVEALDFLFAEGNYSKRKIENKLRVILLDLNLPKLNGIEILRKIKNDDRTKTIPVVIMTSSSE